MNFDKLPNEIQRMIFGRNREAAKDNRYKQNFEMLQLELRMLFEEEEERPQWSTGDTGPSKLHYLTPFASDGTFEGQREIQRDLIQAWYTFANHKVLPCYDFVNNYLCNCEWLFGKYLECDDPDKRGWVRSCAIEDALYIIRDITN